MQWVLLCGLVVRVPGYGSRGRRSDESVGHAVGSPLWSSGQSSWLRIQRTQICRECRPRTAPLIGHDSILSAIIHRLDFSGHMLLWTFFLVLLCSIRVQILSGPFCYTLNKIHTIRPSVHPTFYFTN
jgi:hypothetical protein